MALGVGACKQGVTAIVGDLAMSGRELKVAMIRLTMLIHGDRQAVTQDKAPESY